MPFPLSQTIRALRDFRVQRRQAREYAKWVRSGYPNPPPHSVKQQVLRGLAHDYGLEILVETGTFRGDMVAAMLESFHKIFSIELSEQLYIAARRRFQKCTNVEIVHGDSGVELARLLPRLDRPTLFWLDGHYSAGATARGASDTPIFEELSHILNSPMQNYVIVIDDARLFGTDSSYPTFEELRHFIQSSSAGSQIHVETDSIRVTLKQSTRAAA